MKVDKMYSSPVSALSKSGKKKHLTNRHVASISHGDSKSLKIDMKRVIEAN